jgi:lipopolysaccharide export system protein LptA
MCTPSYDPMPSAPSLPGLALALATLTGVAGAQPASEAAAGAAAPKGDAPAKGAPPSGSPLGFGTFGKSKEPIYVVSDNLEYDYKKNVVVYRGKVQVTQGDVKLVSDTLTITLQSRNQDGQDPKAPTPPTTQPAAARGPGDAGRVQEIVALGNVRIDQGTRWAVGGRAVFDQSQRTLVMTENPVLHDGPSEVAGDRVVVFLDEDRSIVEGGQKRVKAVLYPNEKNAGPSGPAKPGAPAGRRPGRKG